MKWRVRRWMVRHAELFWMAAKAAAYCGIAALVVDGCRDSLDRVHKARQAQPCSEFEDDEVAGIPARCLKDFLK